MKGLSLIFLPPVFALFVVGCSSANTPVELASIEALKSQTAPKISTIRLENLKQTARGIAAQASLSWRSRQINLMLNSQKRNLDRIFDFNYLMLNQNVLPPILVEGRNILNLADDFTIRVADQKYQIVQPPRFITVAPNWRNYIWMEYKKPETPNATLLPQNSTERRIWNDNIQVGWNDGITQADQIFSTNLARLRRDYEGMILYRKLLAQHMVSPPYVSQAELGVTGDSNNIHINDRVLRITSVSQLQPDPTNWHPVMPIKEKQEHPQNSLLKSLAPINRKEKV
jgi:defect-in-organelle-trafficking protein DotC